MCQIIEDSTRLTEKDMLAECDDELQDVMTDNDADGMNVRELYHVAKYLCMEMKKVKCKMPNPPSANDLTTDHIQIPNAVYNFLDLMLSSEEPEQDSVESEPVSDLGEELDQHVLSVGQDLQYTIS